jgi:sulfur carrier protein
MKLTINGKEENISGETILLPELLTQMKVEMPEMVSVELNGDFLERNIFAATSIKEGDKLEFLYFMGGGSHSR